MEWLFANGNNLDLAYNKEIPYAVDPRLPRTREVLQKLWEEVFFILKPQTIHFGLDEVDMLGFGAGDPELVTQMWERHIPFLASIAKKYSADRPLRGKRSQVSRIVTKGSNRNTAARNAASTRRSRSTRSPT